MSRTVGRGRAGFLVGGLMAVAGFGLVGCESDDRGDGLPLGGSSPSVGLAPDGRCAEVYTEVEQTVSDHSVWGVISVHREGAGLGGTLLRAGQMERWTLRGWDRQAFLDPDGNPLDNAYASRMELLDQRGDVKATAFFHASHVKGSPELLDAVEIRVGPPEAMDWEGAKRPDSMTISLLPATVDDSILERGFDPDCL